MKLYFPTLVVRQKWHTDKRNVCVSDIVSIKDSKMLQGNWRLGQVEYVYPDSYGQVRNVKILVKLEQRGPGDYIPSPPQYLKRHVASIMVILPVKDQFGSE